MNAAAAAFVLAPALALGRFLLAGCTRTVGEGDPDIEAARTFDRYPLYWVGEHFEEWDLEHINVAPGGFSTFIYGTCELQIGTNGVRVHVLGAPPNTPISPPGALNPCNEAGSSVSRYPHQLPPTWPCWGALGGFVGLALASSSGGAG